MKFFIPDIDDKEQEQRIYEAIRKFLAKKEGANLSDRKIFSLSYYHKGKIGYAEVGMPSLANGETVKAILDEPSRRLYSVCTNNRGVIRGIPILVGYDEVEHVIDFDKE
jgi:hypothetical protein